MPIASPSPPQPARERAASSDKSLHILINMSFKFIAITALCIIAFSAGAQSNTNIAATTASAYNQDNQGNVVRSQYGLCWRTGYWTQDNSISGCDGELTPPIANPIAPPLVANPAAVSNAATSPATTGICNFSVTLKEGLTFSSGQVTLNKKIQRHIEQEVGGKLADCGQIDHVLITGYADRLGSMKQNQEISLKRAKAVAAFLKSKNINTPIQTVGAGSSEPISNCAESLPARKLTSCLSPDRRVVISVQGHEK